MALAVAKVVLEVVALSLQGVVALVFNLPAAMPAVASEVWTGIYRT